MQEQKSAVTYVVTPHNIISALAYCGISQSPYTCPKNLQQALDAGLEFLRVNGPWSTVDKKAGATYIHVEEGDLWKLIDRMCKEVQEIQLWNVTQWEQDMGITDADSPDRKVKFGAVGRGIAVSPEDRDFIDLDALSRNVFGMVAK